MPYATVDGWAQWLLIHRSVSHPEGRAFYRAFGPAETPLEELAQVVGTRWIIEEGFQRGKEIGLDQEVMRASALTSPEVGSLLAVLLLSREQHQHRLHSSRWRRQRQAEARSSHCRRQLVRSVLEVPV